MKFFPLACLAVSFLFSQSVLAQEASAKKPISYQDYDIWNSIQRTYLSPDGRLVVYQYAPGQGDAKVVIQRMDTLHADTLTRATGFSTSADGRILGVNVTLTHDSIRQLKLNKVDKKKWPEDTLFLFRNGLDYQHYPGVKSYQIARNGWVAISYKDDGMLFNALPKKMKKRAAKRRRKTHTEFTSEGTSLRLVDPRSGRETLMDHVKSYEFSHEGGFLVVVRHRKVSQDSLYVSILDTRDLKEMQIHECIEYHAGASDRNDTRFAFISSSDTSKVKRNELRLYFMGDDSSQRVVDSTHRGLPFRWMPSPQAPTFSDGADRIYFRVLPIPDPEKKDTLLDEEKVSLDVWSWQDDRIMPYQLKNAKRDKERAFEASYDISSGTLIQIADSNLYDIPFPSHGADWVLTRDYAPYYENWSWQYPWMSDIYAVNYNTGLKRKVLDSISSTAILSPDQRHIAWYRESDSTWLYKPLLQEGPGKALEFPGKPNLARDVNGMPMLAGTYGTNGWLDSSTLVIRSEFDLYTADLSSGKTQVLTLSVGKARDQNLSLRHFRPDSLLLQMDHLLILGFDNKTKATYLYRPQPVGGQWSLDQVARYDASIREIVEADSSYTYLMRKETFQSYPDIYYGTDLAEMDQISRVNPMLDERLYGTVELVDWVSYAGDTLQGLMYLPEGKAKKGSLPVIVYFYELYSQMLHRHYPAAPTASIVYPGEYVSNGYAVFIPDIRYQAGHPAKGAYDCIMSGVDSILVKFPQLDSTRMALQGQSWGGYQTAQLITMTSRFRCGMAGAPVSNMFSAYGGIRWGSGLSREFQYERSQSRIGKTIWEAPELYVENSPLFHLPQVQTPLLIMHNDEDGAVPWYQGIELYMGLRRLSKPVWMLVYNGEAHNLRKWPNKVDLSRRMLAFFDYYLQGAEKPQWMDQGVPAVVKGEELRY